MQGATDISVLALSTNIGKTRVTPKLKTVNRRFDFIVKNRFYANNIKDNTYRTSQQPGELEEFLDDHINGKEDMN